jgi:hypothetical protein
VPPARLQNELPVVDETEFRLVTNNTRAIVTTSTTVSSASTTVELSSTPTSVSSTSANDTSPPAERVRRQVPTGMRVLHLCYIK